MRRRLTSPAAVLSRLTMSRPERAAARAERRAEREIRRERDNEQTADRRAAALEAERRRSQGFGGGGYGGPGL